MRVNVKFLKRCMLGALLAFASFMVAGCLASGGGSLTNLPENEFTTLKLKIQLAKLDASAPVDGGVFNKRAAGLGESESIQLRDMVLRFTSNLGDTVWDTTYASVGSGLSGSQTEGEKPVVVDVELAPLRWWNIEVRTHDQYDSLIHYGNVGPIASKGGQDVILTIPLINSRFSMYEAHYSLPDNIYDAKLPENERVYQKIFFSKLVLAVDSVIVRDSSTRNVTAAGTRFFSAGASLKGATGSFFFKPYGLPDTVTHLQSYQYVRNGLRTFEISAYGYLQGDSVGAPLRLLFQGRSTMTISTTGTTPGGDSIPPATSVVLDWKGPGSKNPAIPQDSVKPGGQDWTGVTMTVDIGPVRTIKQIMTLPGNIL
jgi:hypothetical protein